MYSVSEALYRRLADALSERVAGKNYYSGTVCLDEEGASCRLTGSYIVYRSGCEGPEGRESHVNEVVPVWWEFHTVTDEGEVNNDFSFRELRPLLAD